jgi:hypothetical protein
MQQTGGNGERRTSTQKRGVRGGNAENTSPVPLCAPLRPLRLCAEGRVSCIPWCQPVPQTRPTIAQRFNAGCWSASPAESRQGRQNPLPACAASFVPAGTRFAPASTPALKRWAILGCPYGTRFRSASSVFPKVALVVGGAHLLASATPPRGSADFQICCIAGFPTCGAPEQSVALVPVHALPIWKSAIQQVGKPALRRSASRIPTGFDVNSRGCNPRNRRRAAPSLKGPNRWPASPFDPCRVGDGGGGPFSGFHQSP